MELEKLTEENHCRGYECGRRKRSQWIPRLWMIWVLTLWMYIQIIMGIEEEFDIEIPNEEAEKIVYCRRCGRSYQERN